MYYIQNTIVFDFVWLCDKIKKNTGILIFRLLLQTFGLCLFSTNHGDFPLEPVSTYGLYFTEDDGEVDRDFPCLDSRECVAKFGFTCLGLVEHKNVKNVSFESTELFVRRERPEEKEDSGKYKNAVII